MTESKAIPVVDEDDAFADVLPVGTRVDALDTASKWLVAQVLERKIVHTPSRKDKPVELLVLLKNSHIFADMKAAIVALNAGQFNLYNHGTFVTKLQLTSVRFETDQQLEDFSVALARNLTIDNLSLSRNDLDEKRAIRLAEALKENKRIQTFNSENNLFGAAGFEALVAAAAAMPQLLRFSVRAPLSLRSIAHSARLLNGNKTLLKLHLSNVSTFDDLDDVYAQAYEKDLAEAAALEAGEHKDKDKEKEAAPAAAVAVAAAAAAVPEGETKAGAQAPRLSSEASCAAEFVKALENNDTMTWLSLNLRQLGIDSIKAICGALLSERSAVMNVDLPVSRVLGREDAEQLLKVLLANRRLQALTVYSGLPSTEASMGDATTWLLRQLLRNHPTLIELTVRGYPWRSRDLPDVISDLKANNRIVEFSYGPAHFVFPAKARGEIAAAIASNRVASFKAWKREIEAVVLELPEDVAGLISEYAQYLPKFDSVAPNIPDEETPLDIEDEEDFIAGFEGEDSDGEGDEGDEGDLGDSGDEAA